LAQQSSQSSPGPFVDDDLQQRIAEALAPVIDRVRQEMSGSDDTGDTNAEPSGSHDTSVEEIGDEDDRGFSDDEPGEPESDVEQEESSDDDEDSSASGGVGKSLLSALPGAFHDHGDRTLDSMLESVLDVIFSDRVRDAIQEEREEVVKLLLDNALATIDDIDTQRELRRKIHGDLHDILEETIDTIFSGSVRRHLSVNLQQAIEAGLNGNIGLAIREVGEAFERAFGEILECFQEYWLQLLQIVMSIAFEALKETVTSAIKEGTGANFGEAKEKLEGTGEELRDKLNDAAKRLRGNIEDARDDMRDNIKEGLQSAMPGSDGGEKQIGRRPATRPPSRRHPNGRPPSGRPPSGRPPSADR
jgi:hypothetical protein